MKELTVDYISFNGYPEYLGSEYGIPFEFLNSPNDGLGVYYNGVLGWFLKVRIINSDSLEYTAYTEKGAFRVDVKILNLEEYCKMRDELHPEEAFNRLTSEDSRVNLIRGFVDDATKSGKVLIQDFQGKLLEGRLENICSQPIEGLLYDLNRSEEVLYSLGGSMLINNIAATKVIRYLHGQVFPQR